MNPTGELIKKYFEAHNRHEVESVKAMLADSHVFSTCHGMEMSGDQYVATIGSLMEAFPDVHFDIRKVYVEGDKEYADIVVTGTHTGPAWGVGDLPKIETTGIKCTMDPEKIELEQDANGKITKLAIVECGAISGPMGFYQSIGGKLPSS